MKNSLCAHCLNCSEIKYDGFFCDETGYIESKDFSDGCKMFRDDSIEFFAEKLANTFKDDEEKE